MLDFNNSIPDFRDFLFEQLHEVLRVGPADVQGRSFGGGDHIDQDCLDPITRFVKFARDDLVLRKECICFSKVDDQVPALHASCDPGDDLALEREVLVEDDVALGITDLLENDLFRGLSVYPTEARGFHLHTEFVSDLGLGIEFECVLDLDLLGFFEHVVFAIDHLLEEVEINISGFFIVMGFEDGVRSVLLLRSGEDRLLDGTHDDFTLDATVAAYGFDHPAQFSHQIHGQFSSRLGSFGLSVFVLWNLDQGFELGFGHQLERNPDQSFRTVPGVFFPRGGFIFGFLVFEDRTGAVFGDHSEEDRPGFGLETPQDSVKILLLGVFGAIVRGPGFFPGEGAEGVQACDFSLKVLII